MEKLKEIIRLSERSPWSLAGLILVSILAGLCSFSFIALVNQVIQSLMTEQLLGFDLRLALSFAGVIGVFILSRRFLAKQIIVLSQNIFWNIRKQIIRMSIQSDYLKMRASKDEIYSTLTADASNITNASLGMIDMVTSMIMILACFVYMIFVSPVLFGISLAVIAVGVIFYQLRVGKLTQLFDNTRGLESNFLKHFNATLSGTKEINIERKKGVEIYDEKLVPITQDAFNNNKRAFVGYLNSQIIGQILFYSLIAFIILYAGFAFAVPFPVIISFVFILLYVLGPIENIMITFPFISRAVVSAKRLLELRDELANEQLKNRKLLENNAFLYPLQHLVAEQLEYTFETDKNSFTIGPIDLQLNRGEIVFIHGGNGSGKTTFIYTLLGLYQPTRGRMVVNGQAITEDNRDVYKQLYAPVFSDFYLFDEFYSVGEVNEAKLRDYLELFEIDEKVTIEGGKFSTTDLSTGQRKRLALIAVLLEDKPVLVLDEWAADQDPYFRKKFYTEILPRFKKEGWTIIAITHDDKYYDCCDRLLKMDYGRLYELTEKAVLPT
ncbi:MAG: cyclic peptide export ABC transporter [Bacteroidota bacterium]